MIYRINEVLIDTDAYEVRRDGDIVPVEPQVFDLLVLLIENSNRLVTKDEIIERIWHGRVVSEAALSSRIKSARQTIGDNGVSQALIRTTRGRGFRFVGDVSRVDGTIRLEVCTPTAPRVDPFQSTAEMAASACEEPLWSDDTKGNEASFASAAGPLERVEEFTLPKQPSVVVLPFVVLGGEPQQQIMADGLIHDLITRLGRNRWLFLIDRGTAFALRRATRGAREIGRLLGVRYVAQGSVQFSGSRLRVNAALAEATGPTEIWGDRFDYDLDGIFAIQDEISEAIASAVGAEIEHAEQRRALKIPWERLDAWTAYHRGCWHMYRFTREDYEEAERFFSLAVKLEPDAPRAYAGLSFVHWQRAFLELSADRQGEIRQATELARYSLSLDPRDPQGHWALGRAFLIQRDFEQAVEELESCVALGPSFALGHYSLGYALVSHGDAIRGAANTDIAQRLSPLDPMRFAFWGARACALALLGKVDEAADLAARAARQSNAHHHLLAVAAWCHSVAGRDAEARTYLARVRRARPAYTTGDYFRSFPIRRSDHLALIHRAFRNLGVGD